MIYHIDVSSVLRRTVCDLYSNLVTRPTGAAVRKAIEEVLAELPEPNVTIIDFTQVNLLDFSCADEVVGKLLDTYRHSDGRPQRYFLIRGVRDVHLEAIEAVLERYDLAVIVEDELGNARLVGTLDAGSRRAWQAVRQYGRVVPRQLEEALGESPDAMMRWLDDLWDRRLVMRRDDGYVSLPQGL